MLVTPLGIVTLSSEPHSRMSRRVTLSGRTICFKALHLYKETCATPLGIIKNCNVEFPSIEDTTLTLNLLVSSVYALDTTIVAGTVILVTDSEKLSAQTKPSSRQLSCTCHRIPPSQKSPGQKNSSAIHWCMNITAKAINRQKDETIRFIFQKTIFTTSSFLRRVRR